MLSSKFLCNYDKIQVTENPYMHLMVNETTTAVVLDGSHSDTECSTGTIENKAYGYNNVLMV